MHEMIVSLGEWKSELIESNACLLICWDRCHAETCSEVRGLQDPSSPRLPSTGKESASALVTQEIYGHQARSTLIVGLELALS